MYGTPDVTLTLKQKGYASAILVLAASAAIWLFASRWTPDEAANAQHFHQAMLEVRSAIAYANERGGMITPRERAYLASRYEAAARHAALVHDNVLAKLHPKLPRAWREAFLPSTHFYIRAFKDEDRDLARHAGQIQDNWIRWLKLNGPQLDIPPAPEE